MDEETFIDIQCPHCGETITFRDDRVGLLEECPICMESVIVPVEGGGAGRKLPIPIQTERLVLRRLAARDLKDLIAIWNDEGVRQKDAPLCEEATILRWLEDDAKIRLTQDRADLYLGVVLPAEDHLLGFVTVRCEEVDRRQALISATVIQSKRCQGYATEAVRALLRFCLEDMGMHRIMATCESPNTAARRMLEKAGLRAEGEFLQDRLVDGQWVDTVYYALLQEEYRAAEGASPA